MPHTVHKTGKKGGAKRWAIVNKVTGQIVGHSPTKTKAQASARIRDQASGHK